MSILENPFKDYTYNPTRMSYCSIPPILPVGTNKVDVDELIRLRDERDKARLDYVDVLRRQEYNEQKAKKAMTIENVIFNPPATIVFWADGTKTVVKCQSDGFGLIGIEPFDPEKGLAMAFMKKMLGNKGNYYNVVDKWVHPYWQDIYDKRAEEIEKDWQAKFKEELNSKNASEVIAKVRKVTAYSDGSMRYDLDLKNYPEKTVIDKIEEGSDTYDN